LECEGDINKHDNDVDQDLTSLRVRCTSDGIHGMGWLIRKKGRVVAYQLAYDHERRKRQRPVIAKDEKAPSGRHGF